MSEFNDNLNDDLNDNLDNDLNNDDLNNDLNDNKPSNGGVGLDETMHNEATNDDLERLISRRLDGELSDDEQLAFDRELLRNAELRSLFEAHERIHAMSGAVLSAWASSGALDENTAAPAFAGTSPAYAGLRTHPRPRHPQPRHPQPRHSRRWHMFWWSFPASIAAAIALVTWLRLEPTSPLTSPTGQGSSTVAEAPTGHGDPHAGPATRVPESGLRRVVDVPQAFDRATRNELFYVVDKQGRLYVIEQQRTRTIPKYDPRGGMQRVVEVM